MSLTQTHDHQPKLNFEPIRTPPNIPRTLKNPELQIYKLGSTQQQQVLFNYNIVVVGNLFEIHSTTKRSGEFQEFMKASDVQAICFQACCCYHAIN